VSQNWYALHVKPHKERIVFEQLVAEDIEAFYPRLKVTPKNPRARKIRPFFPGYLFVRLDLQESGRNALQWTPGVHGLVRTGDIPAAVPDNLIFELKGRLEQIEEVGGLKFQQLKKGDRVRIVEGLFEGYEAIFDERIRGRDRVQVLLTYLNHRQHPLQLNVDEVQKL
jgi:transcriptional antiterminator RfaH